MCQKWVISCNFDKVKRDMSEMTKEEIVSEIERLRAEHKALDARVIAFDEQVWLSPEDQVAQKECKKLKLKAKEKIAELEEKLAKLG